MQRVKEKEMENTLLVHPICNMNMSTYTRCAYRFPGWMSIHNIKPTNSEHCIQVRGFQNNGFVKLSATQTDILYVLYM